jgi:O-antigen/teichoic acid export membrane protein
MYVVSPWVPGLALDRLSAKKLLSFGVPFQANSLLALAKDDLLTVFLGKILPFSEVGFIGWAQKWANMPLRFIMDNVIKVTFPAYARLQDNLSALKSGIEKALFAVCFLTFPALVGLAILASPLVEFLPRYMKWQPALMALYFFCLQASFASVSTILTNVLNATGRIKTTLKLMVLWTILTWIFTPIFIYFWGFNGVAPAAVLVATTVVLPIWLVRRIVDFALWDNVGKPLLGALIMGGALWLITPFVVSDLPSTGLTVLLGAIIYLAVMLLLARKKIFEAKNLVLGVIKK